MMAWSPMPTKLEDALNEIKGHRQEREKRVANNKQLHARVAGLEAQLETERMRLAACGVGVLANTRESAAKVREMLPEYCSASLEEVIRAVDAEMLLRGQLAESQKLLLLAKEALVANIVGTSGRMPKTHEALAAINNSKLVEGLILCDAKPVAYLFQHEDTGLTSSVDVQQVEWGFEKNNPRHIKVGPLYAPRRNEL